MSTDDTDTTADEEQEQCDEEQDQCDEEQQPTYQGRTFVTQPENDEGGG